MIQIGQFAKENGVTVKTLHHYEKIGLLLPTKVDEQSGYRFYSKDQSEILRNVAFLKDLGFSLSEIKDIVADSLTNEEIISIFKRRMSHSKRDKQLADRRIYKLSNILDRFQHEDTPNKKVKELLGMVEKEMYSGKYGRGQFISESEKMFDKAQLNNTPLSVIQIDMDYFKSINDTYGYDIGDIVLERSQDAMLSVLYESKVKSLFEKRGGDEFGVTIEAGALKSSKIASDMLSRICEVDYSDVATDLKVKASAGIVSRNKRTKSYNELVQSATIKLYESKRRSR